ncbi:MAG: hypothetical protein ACXABN_15380 [Candidatus Thorarchaeota archaeon]
MEGTGGGSFVAGKLKELEKALEDYFGALNQTKEGIFIGEFPDKPEALEKLEQCEALGVPLVSGGVMDQPHIFLIEIGTIRNVRETYETVSDLVQE